MIEVQHISKCFQQNKALDDLSLSIAEGRIFGLLGPNGAGKTTLIRLLTRISIPDSGEITFKGHPLTDEDVAHIGYLPEERGLYKKMKVSEQAIYFAQLRGLSKSEASRRLKFWFKKFEIESWWNKKAEELSKGMQQKIQFIVTVIHEPSFLIFDEPFSGFDPINAEMLKKEILELAAKGATIILSTHNMASVEEICDDIVLINHGKNVLHGQLNEVKRRFRQNRYRIQLEKSDSADFSFVNEENPLFHVINRNEDDFSTFFELQLNNEGCANQVLESFIKHGNVLSFNEILPSMNDIFIRTVNSLNHQQ